VETFNREWLAKVEIANAIVHADSNAIVLIADKKTAAVVERFFSFCVVIDKGFDYRSSPQRYERLRARGWTIALLDEENGIFFSDYQQLYDRLPLNISKLTDFLFLWGTRQKELLLDRYGKEFLEARAKIVVTGHPRFQSKSSVMQFARTARVSDSRRFRILICCNFWSVNHYLSNEFCKANYGQRFLNYSGLENNHRIWLDQVLDLVLKLPSIDCFDSLDILIRPHPEESCAVYEEAAKGHRNIEVSKIGSIGSKLAQSDLVIHSDSTVAVEAFLLNIPVVSFGTVVSRREVCELPMKVSIRAETTKEIFELIKGHQFFHENKVNNSHKSEKKAHEVLVDEVAPWILQNSDAAASIADQLSGVLPTGKASKACRFFVILALNALIFIANLRERNQLTNEKFRSVDRGLTLDFLRFMRSRVNPKFRERACIIIGEGSFGKDN